MPSIPIGKYATMCYNNHCIDNKLHVSLKIGDCLSKNKKEEVKPELSSDPIYTIGVAADRLGLTVHSLRQYEREGLILTHKTPTGRRLFSDLELEKVRCIKDMIQEQGLNFEGIRRMMALVPCWKLRKCKSSIKDSCYPVKDKTRPCWSTEEKCAHPLPDCRDCPVYQKTVHCDDIKPLIYED
jgi:MerR family transcriptional regulator, heat shock protein HspR